MQDNLLTDISPVFGRRVEGGWMDGMAELEVQKCNADIKYKQPVSPCAVLSSLFLRPSQKCLLPVWVIVPRVKLPV